MTTLLQSHQPISLIPEPKGMTILCFATGKILKFNNREFGMCYVSYSTIPTKNDTISPETAYRRCFTLPDVTLLRCTLFTCMIALEVLKKDFESMVDKEVIIILKHKPTFDVIQRTVTTHKTRRSRNTTGFLARICTTLRSFNAKITYVEPGLAIDGQNELFVDCDKDPLAEDADAQKNPEDFEYRQRVARYQKTHMQDLVACGGYSFDRKKKKPTKEEKRFESIFDGTSVQTLETTTSPSIQATFTDNSTTTTNANARLKRMVSRKQRNMRKQQRRQQQATQTKLIPKEQPSSQAKTNQPEKPTSRQRQHEEVSPFDQIEPIEPSPPPALVASTGANCGHATSGSSQTVTKTNAGGALDYRTMNYTTDDIIEDYTKSIIQTIHESLV